MLRATRRLFAYNPDLLSPQSFRPFAAPLPFGFFWSDVNMKEILDQRTMAVKRKVPGEVRSLLDDPTDLANEMLSASDILNEPYSKEELESAAIQSFRFLVQDFNKGSHSFKKLAERRDKFKEKLLQELKEKEESESSSSSISFQVIKIEPPKDEADVELSKMPEMPQFYHEVANRTSDKTEPRFYDRELASVLLQQMEHNVRCDALPFVEVSDVSAELRLAYIQPFSPLPLSLRIISPFITVAHAWLHTGITWIKYTLFGMKKRNWLRLRLQFEIKYSEKQSWIKASEGKPVSTNDMELMKMDTDTHDRFIDKVAVLELSTEMNEPLSYCISNLNLCRATW